MRESTKPRFELVRPTAPAVPPDPAVQKALTLMHAGIAERWTVTRLARRVGLSRPVFARRFVAETGTSPLRYLTRHRMERAAELLETSSSGLAQIAKHVGYESEFAFNRAFKRHHRIAPGAFRRDRWNVPQRQRRHGPSSFRMAA
jgi:transcriptional regulator GlxA family with amidase domain